MTEPFNPLEMQNLGRSIAIAILDKNPVRMDNMPRFLGAGIYAIFYRGGYPAYETLVECLGDEEPGVEIPIYVGKAIPSGGRKGVQVEANGTTAALWKRLRDHAKSIESANNLRLQDFWCRWLVVEPIWIPLGEQVLISRFVPVWNSIVDGFGNHDPGNGRINGVSSRWDTMHPGRPWAHKFPPRSETAEHIELDVQRYLRARHQTWSSAPIQDGIPPEPGYLL